MTKPLHSARTGSASNAAYHVVYREGQYKVFDKAQRFRCSFATMPAAQAYIDMRTAGHRTAASLEAQTAN